MFVSDGVWVKLFSYVGHVRFVNSLAIGWQPVAGVLALSPKISCDWLQLCHDPNENKHCGKWMVVNGKLETVKSIVINICLYVLMQMTTRSKENSDWND